MPYDDIVLEVEDKMEKALNVLTGEFKGVRTGRASLGMGGSNSGRLFWSPYPFEITRIDHRARTSDDHD